MKLLAALLVLAGCAVPSTPTAPLSDPRITPVVHAVFDRSPYIADVTSTAVEWRIGQPPAGSYAWTAWRVTPGVGRTFTITLHPDFVAVPAAMPRAVAHEGGHVVCVMRFEDPSETCADSIAAAVGY